MTVELAISELDDYTKCLEYINSKKLHVTSKMIIRDCRVKPKIANRALKAHAETMLCSPHEFGSNKFVNYNLYKKVNRDTIKHLCEKELKNKFKVLNKDIKENKEQYINSSLPELLYNKYRIIVDYNILNSL
jgi:hypothetical protein